jgi:tRNA (guanine-N7-)-methyltransferase
MASSGSGKRHRIRAHINPLAVTYFDYPRTPAFAPWHEHFPHYFQAADEANAAERACVPVAETGPCGVTIADVGCGFGGLLETLAPLFPDQLILGLEIRDKVVDIVKKRIAGLRAHAAAPASAASATSAESTASTTSSTSLATPPPFGNISVLRSNAMKHLINYFHKGQVCWHCPCNHCLAHFCQFILHTLTNTLSVALIFCCLAAARKNLFLLC